MDNNTFNAILDSRLDGIENVLANKATEYATEDRLYNFKVAAKIQNTTVAKALWGMANKHLVSVIDLVEGRLKPTDYLVSEKIGDMINYLILLEAVLREQ